MCDTNEHTRERESREVPLALDESFQSGQRLIPLLRHDISVFSDLPDRRRIELEQAFASGSNAPHDLRALEDTKMFGDGLPSQPRTVRKLGDGAAFSF
jgi:hypothetical protein